MIVFVIDSKGQPLLPTHPSKSFLSPSNSTGRSTNPTKTCTEKKGFRHYDLVKSSRGGKTVVGSVRSLKANQIALRTKSDDNYLVSYSKSRLLCRFAGLIYSW
jgi:hypothetical protein